MDNMENLNNANNGQDVINLGDQDAAPRDLVRIEEGRGDLADREVLEQGTDGIGEEVEEDEEISEEESDIEVEAVKNNAQTAIGAKIAQTAIGAKIKAIMKNFKEFSSLQKAVAISVLTVLTTALIFAGVALSRAIKRNGVKREDDSESPGIKLNGNPNECLAPNSTISGILHNQYVTGEILKNFHKDLTDIMDCKISSLDLTGLDKDKIVNEIKDKILAESKERSYILSEFFNNLSKEYNDGKVIFDCDSDTKECATYDEQAFEQLAAEIVKIGRLTKENSTTIANIQKQLENTAGVVKDVRKNFDSFAVAFAKRFGMSHLITEVCNSDPLVIDEDKPKCSIMETVNSINYEELFEGVKQYIVDNSLNIGQINEEIIKEFGDVIGEDADIFLVGTEGIEINKTVLEKIYLERQKTEKKIDLLFGIDEKIINALDVAAKNRGIEGLMIEVTDQATGVKYKELNQDKLNKLFEEKNVSVNEKEFVDTFNNYINLKYPTVKGKLVKDDGTIDDEVMGEVRKIDEEIANEAKLSLKAVEEFVAALDKVAEHKGIEGLGIEVVDSVTGIKYKKLDESKLEELFKEGGIQVDNSEYVKLFNNYVRAKYPSIKDNLVKDDLTIDDEVMGEIKEIDEEVLTRLSDLETNEISFKGKLCNSLGIEGCTVDEVDPKTGEKRTVLNKEKEEEIFGIIKNLKGLLDMVGKDKLNSALKKLDPELTGDPFNDDGPNVEWFTNFGDNFKELRESNNMLLGIVYETYEGSKEDCGIEKVTLNNNDDTPSTLGTDGGDIEENSLVVYKVTDQKKASAASLRIISDIINTTRQNTLDIEFVKESEARLGNQLCQAEIGKDCYDEVTLTVIKTKTSIDSNNGQERTEKIKTQQTGFVLNEERFAEYNRSMVQKNEKISSNTKNIITLVGCAIGLPCAAVSIVGAALFRAYVIKAVERGYRGLFSTFFDAQNTKLMKMLGHGTQLVYAYETCYQGARIGVFKNQDVNRLLEYEGGKIRDIDEPLKQKVINVINSKKKKQDENKIKELPVNSRVIGSFIHSIGLKNQDELLIDKKMERVYFDIYKKSLELNFEKALKNMYNISRAKDEDIGSYIERCINSIPLDAINQHLATNGLKVAKQYEANENSDDDFENAPGQTIEFLHKGNNPYEELKKSNPSVAVENVAQQVAGAQESAKSDSMEVDDRKQNKWADRASEIHKGGCAFNGFEIQ